MAQAKADTLRTKAFGAITNAYTTLGTVLVHPLRIFKLTNTTDADLLISFDGTTDQLFLAAGSFTLYDLSTNAPPLSVTDNLLLPIGTQFYVKYNDVPTEGSLWLEGIYAKGE